MPAILITLIIISIILLVIVSVYLIIKAKLETLSKNVFGTSNIFEGFKKQEMEIANTPKSVSSLDSVEVPKILKDFPNLNIDEIKSLAQSAVILYYKSLEKEKLHEINNASDRLNNKINLEIEKVIKNNIKYSNVKIHRSVINSYKKNKGVCTIKVQTSLEYISTKGKETKKVQDRVNTELIYVYDDSYSNEYNGVSLNCKNCGAPIKELGTKSCPYCGTGVVEFVGKVWKIDDIYNV